MSVDWNKEEIQEWLLTCRERQEEYYEFLGRHDWIQYKPIEHDLLKRNIGFALFGGVGEPDGTDEFTGYNKKQSKHINKVFQLILETKKEHRNKDNIWASFLFVSCKIDKNHVEIPVIRVPKYDVPSTLNEDIFIDSSFRVYKNWQDFLDNNKLPDCLMCYPSNGKYFKLSGELQLDEQVSPEGRIGSKVLKGADVTSTVVQCAAVGVGVASMFLPMAWPVLLGIAGANLATGGYVAGRSIAQLRDRNVHQQSIGLGDAESRNCYLGIAGTAMGIVSGGAVAKAVRAAQAGESIALSSRIAIRSISAASCAVNSLGVASGIANIVHKVMNKEEVTGHDIFQVTSAVLFFTNSVISTHQANTLLEILDESNTSFMSKIVNLTKSSARVFTGIGEIVHIENVPGAVGLRCMNASSVQRQFFNVSKDICRKLFEIAQLLRQKLILPEEYRKHIGVYLKKLWDSWNEEINMVIEKICDRFGLKHWSPVVRGGCKYLAGEESQVLKEISKIILTEQEKIQSDLKTSKEKSTSQNELTQSSSGNEMDVGKYQDAVIEISKKFADQKQCEGPQDFIRYLKFTCKFVRNEFIKHKQNYDRNLEILRKFSPQVTVEEFDRESGIQTNHNQYFLENVMKDFKTGNGLVMLEIAYDKHQTEAEEASETSFLLSDEGNVTIIAIENEKGLGTDGWFCRDQYLALARKLIGDKANVALEEDAGDAVMIIGEADKIINVTTQKKEDNREIYGIALMLDYTPQACL